MPHFISLEPWTPGILESLIWINSFGDDPEIFMGHVSRMGVAIMFSPHTRLDYGLKCLLHHHHKQFTFRAVLNKNEKLFICY